MPSINAEHRTIIDQIARRNAIPPAALMAVIDIESAGHIGTIINNTLHPTIRFEGHYFDRRLDDGARALARAQGLASPNAGAVKNPRGQKDRYALLARAKAINEAAAIESTSWGVGQVMGSHWRMLGYASAAAFADHMQTGFAGQVEAMVRFIVANKLDKALRGRDWQAFARGYNGPGFAKNKYDIKLARAYKAHTNAQADTGFLKQGAFGTAVRSLQEKLAVAGYDIAIDGIFGRQTSNALKAFQKRHRLLVDGIYGPATAKALSAQPMFLAKNSQLNRLIAWLCAFTKQLVKPKH